MPTWMEVAAAGADLRLACTPAELHGALCGWLAAGADDAPDWLQTVMVDPDLPLPAQGDALDRLHAAAVAQFGDAQFGFALLLPDDDRVPICAEAMFDWCRGFLGGFGLVPCQQPLSEEGEEALRDIGNLAAAQVEDDSDGEDEEALAEIEEYLRVAVLLLHADRTMAVRPDRRLH